MHPQTTTAPVEKYNIGSTWKSNVLLKSPLEKYFGAKSKLLLKR